ncbi:hypothetical protein HPB51_003716 [Rhipicephalus microplus]|uniref:Uncharacterized protein n=1 Tax=Rhipicephalus microplus TaxID=6941 RepID=A0A9J6E611_RHIMP|nr:hypothetical protein HPB51_003716 [Rhipicephalus microplus]
MRQCRISVVYPDAPATTKQERRYKCFPSLKTPTLSNNGYAPFLGRTSCRLRALRCARIISTLHALRRRHRRRIQGQGELLKLHSQYHGCVLDLSQRYFPAVRPTYQYETRAREKPLTPRGADKKPPNSPVL